MLIMCSIQTNDSIGNLARGPRTSRRRAAAPREARTPRPRKKRRFSSAAQGEIITAECGGLKLINWLGLIAVRGCGGARVVGVCVGQAVCFFLERMEGEHSVVSDLVEFAHGLQAVRFV